MTGCGGTGLPDADEFPLLAPPVPPLPPPNRVDLFGSRLTPPPTGLVTAVAVAAGPFVLGLGVEGAWLLTPTQDRGIVDGGTGWGNDD